MHEIADTDRPTRKEAAFADWREDHRDLPWYGREQAILYIGAIVSRDPFAREDDTLAQSLARSLFVRFRTAFDDLRGPFAKSDREDVARAMARI